MLHLHLCFTRTSGRDISRNKIDIFLSVQLVHSVHSLNLFFQVYQILLRGHDKFLRRSNLMISLVFRRTGNGIKIQIQEMFDGEVFKIHLLQK